jgi:hypothetical protein
MYGIAISVFRALPPCAPRSGAMYASRDDTRTPKSSTPSMTSLGRPGPVGDGDAVLSDGDGDLRRDLGFLAGVERVVHQLLAHDQGPLSGLMPGLRDQLLAAAEIEEPAGLKGGAVKLRRS